MRGILGTEKITGGGVGRRNGMSFRIKRAANLCGLVGSHGPGRLGRGSLAFSILGISHRLSLGQDTKIDKKHYLKIMNFPSEWDEWGMYPDELAAVQLPSYEPGHEDSPEHDRNGAFHWWLRNGEPTKELMIIMLKPKGKSANFLAKRARSLPFPYQYKNGLDSRLSH